jgi:hypothetical protein
MKIIIIKPEVFGVGDDILKVFKEMLNIDCVILFGHIEKSIEVYEI